MKDQLDVPLEDEELRAEVELTTNLMIAASSSEERLSLEDIDLVLEVVPSRQIPEQKIRDIATSEVRA